METARETTLTTEVTTRVGKAGLRVLAEWNAELVASASARDWTTSMSNKWKEIEAHIRGLVALETGPARRALGERLLKRWEKTQKGPREIYANSQRKTSKQKGLFDEFE